MGYILIEGEYSTLRYTQALTHCFFAAALDLISKNANAKENKIALKLEKKVKKLEKVTSTGALRVLDFNKAILPGKILMIQQQNAFRLLSHATLHLLF